MNKNESKYFNTAKKMQTAFIQLLEKKDFEFITIKELCDEAGVNRSTFYLHYDNMNDLLEETMEAAYKTFFGRYSMNLNLEENSTLENKGLFLITPEYLYPYFDFIRENRKLSRIMKDKSGVTGTEKMYAKWFRTIFKPILSDYGVPNEEQEYIMMFYLKGMMGLIDAWVENDCTLTNEQLMEMIKKCVINPKGWS